MLDVTQQNTSGLAVRAFYFNSVPGGPSEGQVWNGSAFESWQDSHYATYAVPAAELGTSARYQLSTPSGVLSAGMYNVVFRHYSGVLASDAVLDSKSPAVIAGAVAVGGSLGNVQPMTPVDEVIGVTSGFGDFAVTVIATSDGTTPVPSATVRMNATGQNYVAITNSSGQATFSVNPGTFTISALCTGFGFSPVTLSVDSNGHWPNGTNTETITLVPVTILPATGPNQTNAWGYTYDGEGNVAPHTTVNFKLFNPNASNNAYARSMFSATSNSIGLIQVTLIQGAKYQWQLAGDSQWASFVAGSASVSQLPELLGIMF